MRAFDVLRIVVAVVAAMWLSVAAGSPSAAQDDEENGRTAAQEVRELVLKQRERVLGHVAVIMAGDEERTESAEKDVDEADEGEDEDEDGEGEDEDGEDEDGEGDDEGEDEGDEGEDEDEGVGGEDCELVSSEAVSGEAEGDAVASDEAEGDASADEAGADEEEDGESVGGEAEDAQPAGGDADTAGEQEVCTLPSTGTGESNDTYSVLSAFAALAAVVAAGFGLRQRFI
jgi:hypothetical protein